MDALKAYLARWAKWMLAGAVFVGAWGVVVLFFVWLVSIIQPWFVISVLGFLMVTAGLALCGFRPEDYKKKDDETSDIPQCWYCGVVYIPSNMLHGGQVVYTANCTCVIDGCKFTAE